MITESAPTVLVVEDDPGVAHLQCRSLERAGFRAIAAATSADAIRELARQAVDLIVLDYRLPGEMTGLDFYNDVKAAGYQVPAIVVTGFSAEVTIIQALRAGVRDFVSKSSEYLEYLPHAVERVLHQVQVEQRLAESEARFQAFMNHSPAVAFIKDEDGRMLYVNRPFEELFQSTDWQGKKDAELWPAETARRMRENDLKILENDHASELVETMPLPNGTLRDFLCHKFPIRDASGRRLLGGTAVDITERRKAEELLRASEAKFRSVSESARDAIVAIDAQGTIVSWNAGASNVFGYSADEVLGQPVEVLMPERYRDSHRKGLERARSTGELRLVGKPVELEGLRRDGSEFPFEVCLGSWQSDGQTYFSGVIRDITERRQSEEALRQRDEQLRHSQKMEALGTLAGGVAHEFNNLLQAILGYTRFAMEGRVESDQWRADLAQVVVASDRAAVLTRQLLEFGRRQTLERTMLDPKQVVRDLVKMLRPLIGSNIELAVDLAKDTGLIDADEGQLQQVLLNLCLNARDAMPSGGRLTIKTANVLMRHGDRPHSGDEDLVAIRVSDTGCGMSTEVRQRIFEPFFTTKEVGKGTGLGLAVAYSLVQQQGGQLHVDSQPGHGSTFTVLLPITHDEVDSRSNRSMPATKGGTELILVADDETMVRDLAVRMLEAAGYRTLTAIDGEDALQVFREHADQISLALLDVTMPRMSGRDVRRQLQMLRPGFRVILSSGHDSKSPTDSHMDDDVPFIQKPFSPVDLLKLIRQTLDAVPSSLGDVREHEAVCQSV